jgi:hypothetical protein
MSRRNFKGKISNDLIACVHISNQDQLTTIFKAIKTFGKPGMKTTTDNTIKFDEHDMLCLDHIGDADWKRWTAWNLVCPVFIHHTSKIVRQLSSSTSGCSLC